MRALCLLFLVFLFVSAAGAQSEQAPRPPTFASLIEQAAPSVVNIFARRIVRSSAPARALDGSAFWRLFRDTLLFGYGQDRISNSLGSGVIVGADGVIVTNHHVIADADGIEVALNDGRTFSAAVILSDARTDIAVLRIGKGELPALAFGDSDALKVGDQVLAIGNPFGLGQTVTSGIVSALARTSFGAGDYRFFIQTDAAINPGNSGGAQIDLDGKLVGINTAIYSTTGGYQGLGFAIPSNMVRRIVKAALEGRPLVHPWIGLSGRTIPPRIAAALGLSGSRGVLVSEVHKHGPAAAAGFAPGDVILAIDGVPVDDPLALRYRIAIREPGEMVKLIAVRAWRLYAVPVTLVAPPAEPPRDVTRFGGLSPFRGARAASLSPALAEEIGADSGISGVVVLDVGTHSAAHRLGLRPGDIVRAIDNQVVQTVVELHDFRPKAFTPWRLHVTRAGEFISLTQPAIAGFAR